MRPHAIDVATSPVRAGRRTRRARLWGSVLAFLVVATVGIGSYGASSWVTLHQQAARIQQQHTLSTQLNARQQQARETATTLRDAVGDLPDTAGPAFTDRDRYMLRTDRDALTAAITAATPVTIRDAATVTGGRIGDWHDAGTQTTSRANANAVALQREQHRISAITTAVQTLDGALAHTAVSVRTHLPDTLAAIPDRSPTTTAAISAAAAATRGPTPADRAHHLWTYVNTLHGTI